MKVTSKRIAIVLVGLTAVSCGLAVVRFGKLLMLPHKVRTVTGPVFVEPRHLSAFQQAIVGDLNRQCKAQIWYQDGYYMGGEPPPKIGVCTDVVVRSYRAAGINLQTLLQQDIAQSPGSYDIRKPDPNIDHRRCRNLAVYFKRNADQLSTQRGKADWQPGDIVIWDTRGDGRPDHIGVIANGTDSDGDPTVVHHWPGAYVAETDWLYRIPIKYHFRYTSAGSKA